MFKTTTRGFSLLETFLAALLFVFSVASIFTALYSIRKPAVNTDQMSQGALAGKQVLEALRYYVDPADYNSSGGYLYPGGHATLPPSVSLPAGGYAVSYVVSTDPPGCVDNPPTTFCGRKVIATVTWPDAM